MLFTMHYDTIQYQDGLFSKLRNQQSYDNQLFYAISDGGICMGVNMGYFGGGFHAGVCLPSCPTSEIAHCNVQVSSCLAGKCCLKDRIMGGYCVGYPTNRNATGIVGMCKPACSSQEVSATEICKSCGALLTKKCCIPKTPGAAAFLG